MTTESADPPTLKNAGRLSYEGEIFAIALGTLAWGLIVVGALLQAVLTNQGRRLRGLALNAGAAAAVVAMMVASTLAADPPFYWESLVATIVPGLLAWGVLAILAFAVGAIVQPPAGRPRGRA